MKSPFQDIIPPEKRSIRNVPLPRPEHEEKKHAPKHVKKLHVEKEVKEEEVFEEEPKDPFVYEPTEELATYGGAEDRSGLSKLFLWLIALACLAALFFAVSWLFAGATVTVALKKVNSELVGTQTFSLTPQNGEVGYSTLVISDTASTEVAATGEKEVTSNASGTIVIYNNFDSNSQKLIAGTRFKTPEGLIYKLDAAITVPGKKGSTPGSVQAKVTAEKPGSSYNIGLTDFTIPGFEGDPRHEAFYARSKTPMTGGAAGTVPIVNEEAKTTAIENLKTGLVTTLKERVQKELPLTSTSISGLEEITYTVNEKLSGEGKAIIEVVGTIKLFVIDTTSFARKLLASQDITVDPTQTYTIDTGSASATTTSSASSTLVANLAGQIQIEYALDPEKFKADIAGKSKDEVVRIVNSNYPQITTIATEIRPFWRSNIPENPDRITVEMD
ncbi:MAG: hypothetical protein WC761_04115 [Candidatus Paceibacterota bacterium]|jgi:hypothetical protein